jgi:hypothetical protein
MIKNLLLSIFGIFLLFTNIQAQSIKGIVRDSTDNILLKNASISLLRAKDSILVKFTRSTEIGEFSITNLAAEKYLMLVTFPDYADYVENFTLSKNQIKDFGNLNLLLKTRLLQEVIFKGEAVQVRVKGDTTEFDANTFKVQPNAKVEDLLRQLPGITVDKDGKITAQGETVTKVLVDGEEFFGDDPTLVTKNIRSDMVDKVQLYDDKSANAKFTGIDDGVRNKTINLQLKEDKKKGVFGKLDAGAGDNDFYSTQGLLNFFNNKKKLSVYSTYGNTRRTGLDWESSRKLGVGGSSNIEISDDGGMMISFGGGNDAFGGQNFYGEGVPKILNTGIHFDNKWKDDKHAINLDYKYGILDNLGFKNTINQNNLPNNLLVNNTNNNFNNNLNQNKFNITYDLKIDTSSNLKVTLENSFRNRSNLSSTLNTGFSNTDNLINDGNRSFNEDIAENTLVTTLFYGKKFKKPGRTLTFRFNQNYSNSESNGILKSDIDFYTNNAITRTDVINQLKENNQESENYKTSLTLTEKLNKNLSLSTNYDFSFTKSLSKLNSFNADAAGNYTELDALFSNDLNFNINTHQGGLSFAYKKDKTNLTVGSKVAFTKLYQDNLIANTVFDRDFVNVIPSLNYIYSFSKQQRLSFNYTGSTKQPSVNQLQPVLNNNDPLNITVGNKDLGIAFSQRFNIGYNSYQVLKQKSIYLNFSYSYTSNDIVNNINTNTEGFSTYTYQNLKENTPNNFSGYFDYNFKLGKSKWNLSLGLNGNGNTNYNIINTELNQNKSFTANTRITLSKFNEKFEMYFSVKPGYQINESSLQSIRNANGFNLNSNFEFAFKLPKKIMIRSDVDYEFQEASSSFSTNFSQLIINTSIVKSFLEKDNLKLTLSGNDLFNQNAGFRRSIFGNNITQTSFNNIQRYFLLSLAWDFSKFGSLK